MIGNDRIIGTRRPRTRIATARANPSNPTSTQGGASSPGTVTALNATVGANPSDPDSATNSWASSGVPSVSVPVTRYHAPPPVEGWGSGSECEAYLVAVGEQIRRNRREKNFAQEAFAAHAEIDCSYYGAIERGERNLSTLNLIRIALRLGVEVGDLFPSRTKLEGLERAEES